MIEFKEAGPLMVFGGPYSNLRATEALIAEADRLAIPPDRVVCTGDVVAYCAEPEETARAVAGWGCLVIQGNCEQQLAAGAEDCACNFEEGSACAALAKGWYPYAADRLSADMRAWMGGLPQTLEFRYQGVSFRVVHGGVDEINRWVFASDAAVLAEECRAANADVVLSGHSGIPFVSRQASTVWFNAGVIGMPANDATSDVWYGLITPSGNSVALSMHRLAYDHHAAAAAMRRSGHANGYARTLVTGLWPSLDVLPPAERAQTGIRLRRRPTRVSPGHRLIPRRTAV